MLAARGGQIERFAVTNLCRHSGVNQCIQRLGPASAEHGFNILWSRSNMARSKAVRPCERIGQPLFGSALIWRGAQMRHAAKLKAAAPKSKRVLKSEAVKFPFVIDTPQR